MGHNMCRALVATRLTLLGALDGCSIPGATIEMVEPEELSEDHDSGGVPKPEFFTFSWDVDKKATTGRPLENIYNIYCAMRPSKDHSDGRHDRAKALQSFAKFLSPDLLKQDGFMFENVDNVAPIQLWLGHKACVKLDSRSWVSPTKCKNQENVAEVYSSVMDAIDRDTLYLHKLWAQAQPGKFEQARQSLLFFPGTTSELSKVADPLWDQRTDEAKRAAVFIINLNRSLPVNLVQVGFYVARGRLLKFQQEWLQGCEEGLCLDEKFLEEMGLLWTKACSLDSDFVEAIPDSLRNDPSFLAGFLDGIGMALVHSSTQNDVAAHLNHLWRSLDQLKSRLQGQEGDLGLKMTSVQGRQHLNSIFGSSTGSFAHMTHTNSSARAVSLEQKSDARQVRAILVLEFLVLVGRNPSAHELIQMIMCTVDEQRDWLEEFESEKAGNPSRFIDIHASSKARLTIPSLDDAGSTEQPTICIPEFSKDDAVMRVKYLRGSETPIAAAKRREFNDFCCQACEVAGMQAMSAYELNIFNEAIVFGEGQIDLQNKAANVRSIQQDCLSLAAKYNELSAAGSDDSDSDSESQQAGLKRKASSRDGSELEEEEVTVLEDASLHFRGLPQINHGQLSTALTLLREELEGNPEPEDTETWSPPRFVTAFNLRRTQMHAYTAPEQVLQTLKGYYEWLKEQKVYMDKIKKKSTAKHVHVPEWMVAVGSPSGDLTQTHQSLRLGKSYSSPQLHCTAAAILDILNGDLMGALSISIFQATTEKEGETIEVVRGHKAMAGTTLRTVPAQEAGDRGYLSAWQESVPIGEARYVPMYDSEAKQSQWLAYQAELAEEDDRQPFHIDSQNQGEMVKQMASCASYDRGTTTTIVGISALKSTCGLLVIPGGHVSAQADLCGYLRDGADPMRAEARWRGTNRGLSGLDIVRKHIPFDPRFGLPELYLKWGQGVKLLSLSSFPHAGAKFLGGIRNHGYSYHRMALPGVSGTNFLSSAVYPFWGMKCHWSPSNRGSSGARREDEEKNLRPAKKIVDMQDWESRMRLAMNILCRNVERPATEQISQRSTISAIWNAETRSNPQGSAQGMAVPFPLDTQNELLLPQTHQGLVSAFGFMRLERSPTKWQRLQKSKKSGECD